MSEIGEDELFEMVNLVPRLTGLPMTIWVSPRGNARHGPRIKVNMTHGRRQRLQTLQQLVGVDPEVPVIDQHRLVALDPIANRLQIGPQQVTSDEPR